MFETLQDIHERDQRIAEHAKVQRESSAHFPPESPEDPPSDVTNEARECEQDCALLGVDEYYTIEELNAARRIKAVQWHPDKLDNMAPELKDYASQQLARFNGAYERLARRVKWDVEPKSLLAECEDAAVNMENLNRELEQLADYVTSGGSQALSRIEKMNDRHNDGVRRMRAFLARVRQEAPTMDVSALEQIISKSVAFCRSLKKSMAKIGEREFEQIERTEAIDDEAERAGMVWRVKAGEILSRNSEASLSEMPFETLKAFQKYIRLRAEGLSNESHDGSFSHFNP